MSPCPTPTLDTDKEDGESTLPPVIVMNPRAKAIPEKISGTELITQHKKKPIQNATLVWEPHPMTPRQASPRRSLTIGFSPPCLCFDLNEDPVVQKLTVYNSTTHSIYVQCCGLWNDIARLGASWKSSPRTRFLLAPGLTVEFTVTAKPRENPCPIPLAHVALQLAASHMRDNVTGYFVVPIRVKFGSCLPPPIGEGG